MCYTFKKMQNDSLTEARASWPTWADFLRQRGLEDLVAWALEAAGPLTVLGAQMLHFSSPLLRPGPSSGQVEAFAGLLEDHHEMRAFAALLRKEPPS